MTASRGPATAPIAAVPYRMAEWLRGVLPLLAWLAVLGVAILLFTALGSGRLAAPPVTDPGEWGAWVGARAPVVATGALLRLAALALAWYLVGVTALGAVARLARLALLVRVADALGVPLVRRVLQASLGVGLATAVVAAAAPGSAHGRPLEPPPVARTADDMADPGDGALPLPGVRPLPDAEARPRVRVPEGTDAAREERDTWTVARGEHLWAIAEAHLHATLDTDPSDDVVAVYWQQLIEANRGRLVDPGDPDLVVPGQVFALPAVQGIADPTAVAEDARERDGRTSPRPVLAPRD